MHCTQIAIKANGGGIRQQGSQDGT